MNDQQLQYFAYAEALNLVEKQIAHINSLKLPFKCKSVLEVGSGPLGKYTEFMIEQGGDVTCLDVRQDHLDALNRKFSNLKTVVGDMNEECIHGLYDIIFSAGNLYHLSKPAECIKHMAEHCTEFLLISSAVINGHQGIDYVTEPTNDSAQAFNGTGCRPSREWIYAELKKYFKYVMIPRSQPNHMDFIIDWTLGKVYNHALRAIFIATNNAPLDPTVWSEDLLTHQTKFL